MKIYMAKRKGMQTVILENKPCILSTSSIVGPKEGNGPLKEFFDFVLEDDTNGMESFEKAESSMLNNAVLDCIEKYGIKKEDINYLFAGDLLNQLISANFAARQISVPFYGIYGACSTFAEALSLGAVFVDGGYAEHVVSATSSHFSSAERQFRFPLEFGNQRSTTSQWTVTGAGAVLIGNSNIQNDFPCITHITTGKVKDFGVTDPNNMGAAMAPAAVDTIAAHLSDTGRKPEYYDLIVTGDLGRLGRGLTEDLLLKYGYNIKGNYFDCGEQIYYNEEQNTGCGGSGCGCSAVVGSGYLYKKLMKGELNKVLLVATGALLSSTSTMQGESIPGIAHAVAIEKF
jgi:stage V sporulation protein AD